MQAQPKPGKSPTVMLLNKWPSPQRGRRLGSTQSPGKCRVSRGRTCWVGEPQPAFSSQTGDSDLKRNLKSKTKLPQATNCFHSLHYSFLMRFTAQSVRNRKSKTGVWIQALLWFPYSPTCDFSPQPCPPALPPPTVGSHLRSLNIPKGGWTRLGARGCARHLTYVFSFTTDLVRML